MASDSDKTTQAPKAANISDAVISRGFLSVILVFLESALTLMLRFDGTLRKLAYPLAESGKVVCIRSYLPHTKVYATFSYRGVLLDDVLPANKTAPDVMINAYSWQLGNVLTSHNPKAVDALQIRGEAADVEAVKAFLVRAGIGGALQSLLGKIKGKPPATPEQKAEKLADYKAKIDEQNEKISTLTTQNRRLNTQLAEIQGKQRSTKIAFIFTLIVAVIALVSHFFR